MLPSERRLTPRVSVFRFVAQGTLNYTVSSCLTTKTNPSHIVEHLTTCSVVKCVRFTQRASFSYTLLIVYSRSSFTSRLPTNESSRFRDVFDIPYVSAFHTQPLQANSFHLDDLDCHRSVPFDRDVGYRAERPDCDW